jgi:hypothetical protein
VYAALVKIGASRQNETTGNKRQNLSDNRTTMEKKELLLVKNSVIGGK